MKSELPQPTLSKSLYHFSVDDVLDSLLEASKEKSIFDHWFFKYFKSLHDELGFNLDLYLFYEKEIDGKKYTLKDINESIKKELKENAWIRFGPHALNYETAPYNQSIEDLINTFDLIYTQIERFAGKKAFSHYVRLHFYSEMHELADYFKKFGVKALFSTEKEPVSYRLPESVKKILSELGQVEYEGISFIRTMFRTEYLVDDKVPLKKLKVKFDEKIEKNQLIVFYVHELELKRKSVQGLTTKLIRYVVSKKCVPFNGI